MASQSKPKRFIPLSVEVVSEIEALLLKASKKKRLNADEKCQLGKYSALLKLKREQSSNGITQLSQKTCLAILRLLSWILRNNSELKEVIDTWLGNG